MDWLRKLLNISEKLPEVELSRLHTDFHSHLIPGIDDGAPDISSSLELIKGLHELGYRKLITTPHVMSDYYKNESRSILKGLDELREACSRENLNVELEAAAEYYLDEGFEKLIKKKDLLTFGNNYVLFELPFISEPQNLTAIIFELQTAGYRPILAHPERYPFWYKDFEKFQDMKDRSVMLQMNILSLTGIYSAETKKIAERMVDEELFDFIGTDCHNIQQLKLIKDNLDLKYLHKLMDSGKLMNAQL